MLVLIDESGDPGFKIVSGSSSHFIIAMVIFARFEEAERTAECITRARERLRVKPEFKFSATADVVKEGFFEAISGCSFSVRAVSVDKSVIYSANLRERKDQFYNYFVRQLMSNDGQTLADARVKLDKCGNREFKKELCTYLRRMVPREKVRSVQQYDSKSDVLLQLADMCAGAIYRARRTDQAQDRRWLDTLRRNGQIGDVWDFR